VSAGRFREFLAGRGTLDVFLDSLVMRLLSEQDVLGPDGDPIAFRELYWKQTWLGEFINRHRYEHARIPVADYLETRAARLGAELDLARTRNERGKQRSGRALPADVYSWPLGSDGAEIRAFARARFEASRSEPARLVEARLRAAEGECAYRLQEFLAGRGTIFIVQDALSRWADAESTASGPDARRSVLEQWWTFAWLVEETTRARYEAFRVPVWDYREMNRYRLGVQLARLRAEKGKGRPGGWPRTLVLPTLTDALVTNKALARARFAAEKATADELLRQSYEAAQEMYEARLKEFLAARGTADILLEASALVSEAKHALTGTEADRRAALERRWQACTEAEELNRLRYESGRIPDYEYMQARHARLDAEIRLIQAKPRQ
jgi:hypothetical protein